jgi:hypothetical protein
MMCSRIDRLRILFRLLSEGLPRMAQILLAVVSITATAGCDINPFGEPSGGRPPMKTTHAVDTDRPRLPPLDMAAPAVTQTATFALG